MDDRIEQLLQQYSQGEPGVLDQIVPLVYDDLRVLARRHANQWPGVTLQTTCVLHDAYIKLSSQRFLDAKDRGHFLAICSQAMRQLMVDYARRRLAEKRGSGVEAVDIASIELSVHSEAEELVLIDQALVSLAKVDERLVRVFECRYFAGLNDVETAEALGLPLRTVQRLWLRARVWLQNLLQPKSSD